MAIMSLSSLWSVVLFFYTRKGDLSIADHPDSLELRSNPCYTLILSICQYEPPEAQPVADKCQTVTLSEIQFNVEL